MKAYHIYIMRHGRTMANEEGIYIGKTDLPLTENGKDMLRELTKEYEYPYVDRVYSSPLERAVQSSEILFPDAEIVIADDFREMDLGAFEGCRADELAQLDTYKKWLRGGWDSAPPNGESIADMVIRCANAFDSVLMDMMDKGFTKAAVVTHSGIIMNTLACFGLPKKSPMDFMCDPGCGYEICTTAQLWSQGRCFEILRHIPSYSTRGFEENYATYDADEDYYMPDMPFESGE